MNFRPICATRAMRQVVLLARLLLLVASFGFTNARAHAPLHHSPDKAFHSRALLCDAPQNRMSSSPLAPFPRIRSQKQ